MAHKERLELTDSPLDMIMKMMDGNPGAMGALTEMVQTGQSIDPDAWHSAFAHIFGLDSAGIYGTDIYVLWSDICGRNMAKMIAVLRAKQMGHLAESVLKDACSRQDRSGKTMVDADALYAIVKAELPNFDPNNVFESAE